MAAKRPRKTIGENPLDDLNQDESDQATPSGQAEGSKAAPGNDASDSTTVSPSARKVAASKRRANASQAKPDAAPDDTAEGVTAPDDGGQASHSADEPQTAEALFEQECQSQQRFSPERAVVVVKSNTSRYDSAMAIVKNWSQWSVAAGVVPVPLLDTVAISGVQLKMVHSLCKHYGVPFEKEAVIGSIGSLVGGAITTSVTDAVAHAVLKTIPFAEQVLQPTLSFATTYSLGYVFVKHFENNGTLRDFKASAMQGYFREQLKRSKVVFASGKKAA